MRIKGPHKQCGHGLWLVSEVTLSRKYIVAPTNTLNIDMQSPPSFVVSKIVQCLEVYHYFGVLAISLLIPTKYFMNIDETF